MMTKDFDPISEFPFHSEEFGEGTPSMEYMLTFYTAISYFDLKSNIKVRRKLHGGKVCMQAKWFGLECNLISVA